MEKVRVDVWPGSTFYGQPGSVRALSLPVAGDYKVRVKLSGLKPKNGRAPHVVIYAADLDRVLLEQDVVTAEDQPVTLESRVHLPAGNHPIRMTNEAPGPSNLPRAGRNGSHPFFSIKDGREPWADKADDEEGQPILPFPHRGLGGMGRPDHRCHPTVAQQQYLPKERMTSPKRAPS